MGDLLGEQRETERRLKCMAVLLIRIYSYRFRPIKETGFNYQLQSLMCVPTETLPVLRPD